MTVMGKLRDLAARKAVMTQLELAYERAALHEQLTLTTDPELASDWHAYASLILRARINEEDDPMPKEPCGCIRCAALYAAGS